MHLIHSLGLLAVSMPALAGQHARATNVTKLSVDTSQKFQSITGFGFSEAFQRAYNIINLPEPQRSEVVDLLFNTTAGAGAGFSILRNGLGSSPNSSQDFMNSILPVSPGAPNNTPTYVFDGKDSGQLWISQQAVKYGVQTFYSDAWSAPGFMKTNGQDSGGGTLCGVVPNNGLSCADNADWRQAYADYLVQYLQFYRDAGVQITHVGFLNEPDIATAYASMQFDGAQAADFISNVLAPTLRAKTNLTDIAATATKTKIACCDGTGWVAQANYTRALQAAGVVDVVITGHGYTSEVAFAQPTEAEVWMTEYSDLSGNWSVAWDSSPAVQSGDGLRWANLVHGGLTAGNVSAYLWWVATQDAVTNGDKNEKLIRVDNATDTYEVSRRFWAFAQYSRVVRPGAVRVGFAAEGEQVAALNTTAFVNVDGSVVVVVINNAFEATELALSVGSSSIAEAQAWVTDEEFEYEQVDTDISEDGTVAHLVVRSRAMVSVVINFATNV